MEMGLEIIKALSLSPTKLKILEIVRDWKNLSEISDRIKLKKQTLVPHLKVLVELGLVKKDGEKFKLTEIGKLTLEKFLETVKFFDVVGNLGDFFNEHDLSPIPPHLLRDVHMLFGGKKFTTKRTLTSSIPNGWKFFRHQAGFAGFHPYTTLTFLKCLQGCQRKRK